MVGENSLSGINGFCPPPHTAEGINSVSHIKHLIFYNSIETYSKVLEPRTEYTICMRLMIL